ncbi:MAG: prepilin-type N-terminal cleavage/methylation domain-containing protein, partial [bacterium]|nr:prepilin-type N-terminal cleavage/methylation domain-containing protein [bacterium]
LSSSKTCLPTGRGFTLIELLVVIAIIGLLASIVLASLNTARKKSRDARRQADLKQLQNALELYANDQGGNYPSIEATVDADGAADNVAGGLLVLAPSYIAAIPTDPLGGSHKYLYKTIPVGSVTNNATGYCVATAIEGTAPSPSSTCQVSAKIANGVVTDGVAGSVINYEIGN